MFEPGVLLLCVALSGIVMAGPLHYPGQAQNARRDASTSQSLQLNGANATNVRDAATIVPLTPTTLAVTSFSTLVDANGTPTQTLPVTAIVTSYVNAVPNLVSSASPLSSGTGNAQNPPTSSKQRGYVPAAGNNPGDPPLMLTTSAGGAGGNTATASLPAPTLSSSQPSSQPLSQPLLQSTTQLAPIPTLQFTANPATSQVSAMTTIAAGASVTSAVMGSSLAPDPEPATTISSFASSTSSSFSSFSSSSSSFDLSNLALAKQFNALYSTMVANSTCSPSDPSQASACVEGELAKCGPDGVYQIIGCPSGMKCFALPLSGTQGIIINCDTPEDAQLRLGASASASASLAANSAVSAVSPAPMSSSITASTTLTTTNLYFPLTGTSDANPTAAPAASSLKEDSGGAKVSGHMTRKHTAVPQMVTVTKTVTATAS